MIRKVPVEELQPGMQVVKLSSEIWEHLPFLYSKPGLLESRGQIERIRADGYLHAFIQVDGPDESGLSMSRTLNALLTGPGRGAPPKPRVPFEQEMQVAEVTYSKAMHHAKRIIHDVKLGRKVDFEASVETVDAIVNSAIRNPDTLLCLSKLSDYDEYTYAHCINVAAISVVFGEYLGLPRDELVRLGLAGMMHDLGKTAVPARIINKRARLTATEFEEIKRHPEYGCDILSRQQEVTDDILEAVRDHHEKYNGSGYPEQRTKKTIAPFARIISLADVYDALTSDRSYKDAILPNKALAIMYGMREQDFDPVEVQMFIKCLGIFPSGSLVRLNTGFYGVVYESNPILPLMPKIKIILDEDLHPIPAELVDLAAAQALGDRSLEILECADPAAYRLSLKPYLTRKG